MAIDYAHPLPTDYYDSSTQPDVLEYIRDNVTAAASFNESADPAGKIVGLKRVNGGLFERWNGSAWVAFPLSYFPMSGGTLTGDTTISKAGPAAFELANSLAPSTPSGLQRYRQSLENTGDIYIGGYAAGAYKRGLRFGADSAIYDIATGQKIAIEQAGGGYLPLSGGIATGNITVQHANFPQFAVWNTGNVAEKRRASIYLENSTGDFVLGNSNDAATVLQTGIKIRRDGYIVALNPLIIEGASADASVTVNSVSGKYNILKGMKNSKSAWEIHPGNAATMTGSNAGADFDIARYDDAGNFLAAPVVIARNNGAITFNGLNATMNPSASSQPLILFGNATINGYSFNSDSNLQCNHTSRDLSWYCGGLWGFTFTGPATRELRIVGNAFKPGGGIWTDASDNRIKEQIADYTRGLAEILQLRPRTYHFKPETGRDSSIEYIGLIAQECETILPEMVTTQAQTFPEGIPPGDALPPGAVEYEDMRILDTTALMYAVINAIKELSARVSALETP